MYVKSLKSTGSGFVIEREKAAHAIEWKDGADHVGYEITDIPINVVTIEDKLPKQYKGFLTEDVFINDYPGGILMKLDAELAEVILLNGLSPEIAQKLVAIFGEYHCEGGWNEFLERVDVSKYPQLRFSNENPDLTQPIGLFRAI